MHLALLKKKTKFQYSDKSTNYTIMGEQKLIPSSVFLTQNPGDSWVMASLDITWGQRWRSKGEIQGGKHHLYGFYTAGSP